jgi:hypothetical protein
MIEMNDFSFRERDGLKLLVSDPLEAIGFKNAFSTRLGGVSPLPADALSLGSTSREERENVRENRRRFLAALDAADWTLLTARQFHSAEVIAVEDARSYAQQGPLACDALVSRIDRALLAVQTADCLPILVADERRRAFAAVHAGWRGTLAGIVARTVARLQQEYDSRPQDLHAALGPAISAAVFEVGPEVLEQFRGAFNYAEDLISHPQPDGKGHLNINLANVRQLVDAGVREDRIYDSGLCTWLRNDLFFSYRRENGAEKPVGRLMGVIGRI